MSNSVDPDETAHWAVSSGYMLFAKAYIIACASERVQVYVQKFGVNTEYRGLDH